MKLKKINFIILGIAFVAVLGWVVYEDGVDNLLGMFRMLRLGWLACAVGLMLIYWLLEGCILHGVVKCFYRKQRFVNSFTTSMIGQLFNCITPFSSGGQPVQAFHMVKTGVPLGVSGGSLMIKFIVYQFSLTLYSIVMLLFYWQPLSTEVSGFGYLVFVGFAVNFGVMLVLVGICFFRRFTAKAAHGLIRLLAKIRLVKNQERTRAYIDSELLEFHESFVRIKDHPGMVVQASLLSIVQLTVFFLIPFFICLAFGIGGISPMLVIAAQSFVVMISSFVPLPGAAGGAEYSFHTFFAPFFASAHNSINLAMLLWRLITFYLPILAGMCFMLKTPKERDETQTDSGDAPDDKQ